MICALLLPWTGDKETLDAYRPPASSSNQISRQKFKML
jgi:hypothetical protein